VAFIPVARDSQYFQQAPAPDQVAALCRAHFGSGIEILRVKELSGGLLNSTFTVEIAGMPRMILRVAQPPGANTFFNERHLMRREYAVQPFLRPVCPQAPRILAADFTHRLIDRDYMFVEFIEGEVWADVQDRLSDAENAAIWRQLGFIARRINAVRGERFGFPAPDPGYDRWSDALISWLMGMRMELVALRRDTGGAELLVRWIAAHRALFDQIRTPQLMHGDLWPANILIARRPSGVEVVGILDAERAKWGDPLFEGAYHLGTPHPAFWEGYGERDQNEQAQVRALAYEGIWLVLVIMEQYSFKSGSLESAYRRLAEVNAALRQVEARYDGEPVLP